jgi:hypothetical protein
MFKALVVVQNGEGTNSYASPPGEENLHHSTVIEAAQHIVANYGHGLVVNRHGEQELFV